LLLLDGRNTTISEFSKHGKIESGSTVFSQSTVNLSFSNLYQLLEVKKDEAYNSSVLTPGGIQ